MLGIFLATLIPNPEDIVTAKVVPFVILIVVVSAWVVGMIFTAKEVKDVVPLTAGYAAVLGIILNGAASLRGSTTSS